MKNNIETDDFKNAIIDYVYLLERNYPQKISLKIIGDRYRLNALQRSILFRGITQKETALKRKSTLINNVHNQILLIDSYNVLITIGSYLSGNSVYIALDGFLRDTAESHGKMRKINIIEKSLDILFLYIKTLNIKEVIFFLDSPVSYSRDLSKIIMNKLADYNLAGSVNLVKSADYELIHSAEGICATSDSNIIDKKDKIFDLAYQTLNYHYSVDFFSLNI